MPIANLIQQVKEYNSNANVSIIEDAYEFAKEAHKGQQRRSGQEYIVHPLETSKILADLHVDEITIVAGLLHDVVEDTKVPLEKIEETFGKDVAQLVDGVTKLSRIEFKSKEEQQVENLRKMFLAMAKDIRVIIIKLADRLHNMRTLRHQSPEKQKEIAEETLEIFAPLAHRFGIFKVKWEMEDLALRYMHPQEYHQLVQSISMKRKGINEVITVLPDKLDAVGIKHDIQVRHKNLYSIYNKMEKKKIHVNEIYDLIAVRLVVDSVKDCYGALGIIHTLWKPIPMRFKDYIAMPTPDMYQSLHTTVLGPNREPFEIQIRTWEMHKIAEFGIAAHGEYKEGNKVDLFSDRVYVFTPAGDVMELPAGSVPIDFAYRIHSDVGHQCTGAKISGKIVPLDYKLKTGDIIEVLTNKGSGPSRDWLKIAQTSRSKNRIRQWFRKVDGNIGTRSELFNELITSFRQNISDQNYPKAFSLLPDLQAADNKQYEKLIENLAFLFNSNETLENNKKNWERYKEAINYKVHLWYLLTNACSVIQTEDESAATNDSDTSNIPAVSDTPSTNDTSKAEQTKEKEHSQAKGESLEISVMKLLRELFTISSEEDDYLLTELRKQKAGPQFGFDIQFKYKDASGAECICKMECKDVKDIEQSQILDKLEEVRKTGNAVHHWILISPKGKIANNLNESLTRWSDENRWYPPIHKVQIWTIDNNVEEFFGLAPEIHEHYYSSDKTIDPTQWDNGNRNRVLARWKEKLTPEIPLPLAWKDYLRKPDKLLTFDENIERKNEHSDIFIHYDELYKNCAQIRCCDENNNLINKSAEQYIIDWANKSDQSKLFLLGEFGEGKTFLTYLIARRLAENFCKSPSTGIIPIRMALRNLRNGVSEQGFLRDCLDSFGANINELNDIKRKHKVLIILDGFDEMSAGMNQNSVASNIRLLMKCVEALDGKSIKFIITSRPSVFKAEKQHLVERIGSCEILHLDSIDSKEREEHLQSFAQENSCEECFAEMKTTHDMIGLASKPLFLDMMKLTLLEGNIKEIDSLSIYDNYVDAVLDRKKSIHLEREDGVSADLEDVKGKMKKLLEDFAITSFKHTQPSVSDVSGVSFVDLVEEFNNYEADNMAKYLWKHITSPTEEDNEDARNRIINRSLLKEMNKDHYAFFHRSMQEYFAAKFIYSQLKESPQEIERFLSEIDLTFETLEFAAKKLSQLPSRELTAVQSHLASMIEKTRNQSSEDKEKVRLGTTAVNLYFLAWKKLPNIDWHNLVLDNAYLPGADFSKKDLSNTSLKYACLDNADFTKAILKNCDLTGVRFDETEDIYSMQTVDRSLYVLYSDGKLRKWDFNSNRPKEIGEVEAKIITHINKTTVGLMFFQESRVLFTHKTDDVLEIHGGISHNVRTKVLDFSEDKILYAHNNELSFYNLQTQKGLFTKHTVTEDSKGIIVNDASFLLFNDNAGLRLVTMYNGELNEHCFSQDLEEPDNRDITAISIAPNKEIAGEFRICISNKTGNLALYHFSFEDSADRKTVGSPVTKKIASYSCGKYIKSTCFLDFDQIVYTGIDGVIHVLKMNEYKELHETTQWRLAVNCKGAIIDGVKQQEQYEKLKAYQELN